MGHPQRREADDARSARRAETSSESRKDQPLSLGLSLLIWLVMAGAAWAVVALVLRLA